MPERSSDVVEKFGEKALIAGVGAVLLGIGAVVFFQLGAAMIGFAVVCLVGALGLGGYAIYNMAQTRKVSSVSVICPYCSYRNGLTGEPTGDFTCQSCNRFIPIANGQPMPVQQVRCGYCNTLNFYSDKTEVLLCEDCGRDIPISTDDNPLRAPKKSAFAVTDDTNLYELVLVSHDGRHTENLIGALQQMLALNRNQVKQMLEELPVTLLTGIPKMKAEILSHQLATHGAVADYKPVA